MAEEKKNNEIEIDKSKIHASKMKKGRKTINYLQKCKDEGKKIVQVGVALNANGYNGELTSKQAGSIGGQMVKNMIASYTQNNAQ